MMRSEEFSRTQNSRSPPYVLLKSLANLNSGTFEEMGKDFYNIIYIHMFSYIFLDIRAS